MAYLYKDVYISGDHHRKRSNGCVNEHLLVAEKLLGRDLLPSEVVHHKDENKWNNSEDNLMVFASQSDHSRFHSGVYDDLYQSDNGSWICKIKIEICQYCNSEFLHYKDMKFCSVQCTQLASRIFERPTADKLEMELRKGNFSTVGRLFGVSDNGIRKWCKYYGMSTSAKDYK